jgi:hypothetical protein
MNKDVLRVFIGYDPIESVAWHTMSHSILSQASVPVALVPVNIRNFGAIYTRPRDPKQSNEFSFTRFLVPYLADYQGYALFFDCDMMLRCDIAEVLRVTQEQPNKALYVVKHDYEPRDDVKYLNTVQYKYPRKNWSSVVLWNCGHPANRAVDVPYVNTASAMDLHRFKWLADEDIGELNVRWNWLVGEYDEPPKDVKNVHWTVGGPYFHEYKDCDFSDEWRQQLEKINYCKQRD